MRIFYFCLICTLCIAGTAPSQAAEANAEQELNRAIRFLLERNPAEAVKIIQPLAESGNVRAQVLYGEFFIAEEDNLVEGRIWLYTAAGSGDAYAQYSLAMSYLGSRSVKDIEEGIRWLRKAAEQGYYEAEEQLAFAHAYGRWGLPRDMEQEDFWRQRASLHRANRQRIMYNGAAGTQ